MDVEMFGGMMFVLICYDVVLIFFVNFLLEFIVVVEFGF